MRGEIGQHVRVVGARARMLDSNPELDALCLEEVGVAASCECHDLETVAMVPDDVERLSADRASGAEDDDSAHAGVDFAHQMMPRARTR